MKYIITIYNKKTRVLKTLERDGNTLQNTIEKELRGWNNMRSACTSPDNNPEDPSKKEYCMAGILKDNINIRYSLLVVEI